MDDAGSRGGSIDERQGTARGTRMPETSVDHRLTIGTDKNGATAHLHPLPVIQIKERARMRCSLVVFAFLALAAVEGLAVRQVAVIIARIIHVRLVFPSMTIACR